MAALVDLTAESRWVPFVQRFAALGEDWTGASFLMHVRQFKDTTGTPLISLATVTSFVEGIRLLYAGTATMSAHLAAGRIDAIPAVTNPATGALYQGTDSVLLSQIEILILDDPTLQALPFLDERGEDQSFWYDLIVSPPSVTPKIEMRGKFIVQAGATVT
jgi:hypothetical protein